MLAFQTNGISHFVLTNDPNTMDRATPLKLSEYVSV
jgi:hypothetical protein